jgi:hypothetical protein
MTLEANWLDVGSRRRKQTDILAQARHVSHIYFHLTVTHHRHIHPDQDSGLRTDYR